jgi:hypothetical protein
MTWFYPDELKRHRDLQELAMPLTAQVIRKERVGDNAGGWEQSDVTAYTFPCRLSATDNQVIEREVLVQVQGRMTYYMFYPLKSGNNPILLKQSDKIVITDSESGESYSYEISMIIDPSSPRHVRRALVWRAQAR